ncbi:ABC transporter ATP-binding protein/permease [Tissierella sp. MSJ-40]|uniref:ABC transporter ATP-binding protein/permease n=1 Tax=Tissierella simiarum TaxID=2841534 RepID=A0ABS6E1V8_9FIRM|nr:ABC transporter ATP-binding protein [Tissierella simiarum]MBU5436882.1 ABC transporter ATP-binding protein/permease [Tissierella simiarum]
MEAQVLKRLFKYVGKYKLYIFFALLFALISNILFLISPYFTGKAIDNMIGQGKVDFNSLLKIAMILIFIYITSSLFNLLQLRLVNLISNNTVRNIRRDVFNKISTLPLNYFDTNSHGDIMSKFTNDIEFISEGLLQGINQLFSGIVIIFGSLGFMIFLSIPITLIVVLITPVCFYIASFIARMSNKMFRDQSIVIGELNGYVEEIIGNQKIVKAFNYESRSLERFEEINTLLYEHGRAAQFYSSLTNPSTRFINNLSYIMVCIIGGIMSISGYISIGKISSFLIYSTQFSKPINEITSIISQFQAAMASAERIFEVLDEESEPVEDESIPVLENCRGNIVFDNVNFSYNKNKPLIQNLNINIPQGSTIAIVGPTGAGKTTLINLLMRFYDVDSGEILIDGINIKNLKKDSIRRSFGMVLQDSWLFTGTIRDNIVYGKPDASDEEVKEVLKKSHCDSFVKKLPNGYNTIITENEGNLSQGEKQLLTIARAMLVDPPMLILDEATSNIDTLTEIKIQQGFLELMKGRTSFVIAHRLSTIIDADLILVMKSGKIIEQGNHRELLSKKGFYEKLYNSQFISSTGK